MGYDSEMDGCGQCMKKTLFVVNFLVFIGGLTLAGLSIYALVDNVHYVSELTGNNLLSGVIYVLLVSSICVPFIAFLGCYGALREIRCMLFMYFLILLLLSVVILIGGILGYVYRKNFVDTLQQQMYNSLPLYREKRDIKDAWDIVQSKLHCCGVKDWRDWQRYLPEIPQSCCKETEPGRTFDCNRYQDSINEYNTWNRGCLLQTRDFLQGHASTFAVGGVVVAICLLLGMIFSAALFKMIH